MNSEFIELLKSEGLTSNRKMMDGIDPKTRIKGKTMPDAVRSDGQLVEVKDVKVLSDSKQLRIQNELSRKGSGRAVEVITGKNTKVSGTVQEAYQVKRNSKIGPDPD